jgi:transcriptional regulator with XRE-family HTH domain
MKLGARIKELRRKKGLTQYDLSEKTGLSLRTIQRIENSENKPSVYSLRKIGEALDYTFNLKEFNIMKNIFEKENRNYLILIVALIAVSIGGYFYYSNQLEYSVEVIDMKIESNQIEDFVQFEWGGLREVVRLDADKEIVVRLIYSNKDSNLSGINNFDLKFTLSESNFEKDVAAIEHSLKNLTNLKFELPLANRKAITF